jgi:phage-related tail fiber protein
MSDYFNVTTNVGDAAIATAIANNSKLNITHIAFGDGNGSVPTPTKTRTSLVREVHRQAVTKYTMHPTIANYIVIETIIPSNIGGFWIREMGIIADNVLISHGSHAPFFKVADPDGVSEYRLKFTQNVRDGNVVEISLDESLIYASQAWVNENYIRRNEVVDNLTTDDAFKPVSAKQVKNLQDNKLDKDATAVAAEKLVVGRTVSFSGAATGSFNFDGSQNSSAILTLANSGVTASTYGANLKIPVLTVNAKGLITGVSEQTIPSASETQAGVVKLNNTLTSESTTEALTAAQGKALRDSLIGMSEGVNVTATRLSGVTYTNPYNRPLFVFMSIRDTTGANFKLKIGSLLYNSPFDLGALGYIPVVFMVPPLTQYSVSWSASSEPSLLNFWWEF